MRRRTLLGAAASLSSPGLLLAPPARAGIETLKMVETGGRSGHSIEVGYISPFTRRTGIRVSRESPNPFGRLRAMVQAGQKGVTLYELLSGPMLAARRQGLIEPLDWTAIDPAPMFPEARHEYGLGFQYFSTVMAWHRGARAPANWQDFFNTRAFPGKRCLPNYPHLCLPFAVMATGVPADKLYPLDIDAGFAKLDEIKDDVSVWWRVGETPPVLLRENTVQYAICWSGRIADDPLIGFTFDGGMLNTSYFSIVKGASADEKIAAYGLMHEMSLPANQAAAARVISYTGSSPDLEALLPQNKLSEFPTSRQNRAVQWLQNAEWWEVNFGAVEKRWNDFIDSL